MTITSFTRADWEGFRAPSARLAHMVALRSGTYRPARHIRAVRVVAGCAWVTLPGIDHVLRQGETLHLGRAGRAAVISALGDTTLVLEVVERDGKG